MIILHDKAKTSDYEQYDKEKASKQRKCNLQNFTATTGNCIREVLLERSQFILSYSISTLSRQEERHSLMRVDSITSLRIVPAIYGLILTTGNI